MSKIVPGILSFVLLMSLSPLIGQAITEYNELKNKTRNDDENKKFTISRWQIAGSCIGIIITILLMGLAWNNSKIVSIDRLSYLVVCILIAVLVIYFIVINNATDIKKYSYWVFVGNYVLMVAFIFLFGFSYDVYSDAK